MPRRFVELTTIGTWSLTMTEETQSLSSHVLSGKFADLLADSLLALCGGSEIHFLKNCDTVDVRGGIHQAPLW